MWSKTLGDFFDLVGTFDPRLIPTAAKKGTYFRYVPPVGNPTTLIKADEGLTTNWIEASGGAASDWLLTGNFGPNLILGTLTPDRWNFVADALPRGGFEDDGRFFLKTHQFFPNSESYQHDTLSLRELYKALYRIEKYGQNAEDCYNKILRAK